MLLAFWEVETYALRIMNLRRCIKWRPNQVLVVTMALEQQIGEVDLCASVAGFGRYARRAGGLALIERNTGIGEKPCANGPAVTGVGADTELDR